MNRELIIVGASGHGKVIADIAQKIGYQKIAFLDDNETVNVCMNYPVLGNLSKADNYMEADFFIAIGNPEIRESIQERFSEKRIVTLVHPNAVLSKDVEIGKGTAVMAGAVINAGSIIGKGCIINTGATVDHDNILEDYVHVSVGSHLAGTVKVGKATWIGAGATVSNNIAICGGCMIGAGAVVVNNIAKSGTYVGVPAKKIK